MGPVTGIVQDTVSGKTNILQKAMATVYPIPTHLTLDKCLLNPDLAYLHVATYTATITLHRAVQSKTQNNYVSPDILWHSQMQCLEAATSILRIIEMTESWGARSVSLSVVL
jgi:hypothetical protein